MQVWYDPATMEVRAVYSGYYTGTVWPDAGYAVYQGTERLPRDLRPGAVINFDRAGKPFVETPAPPPVPPPPRRDFAAEIESARDLEELKRILADRERA